ncbi:hypothetical protein HDU88_002450 [Geranomyces variabilis]|nr:hypothetical protein HDU88_002450 [Geranomyces variabilis]
MSVTTLHVQQWPIGPKFVFAVPATLRIRKGDVVGNVAALVAPAKDPPPLPNLGVPEFELGKQADPSVRLPRRVFRCQVHEGVRYWRELLDIDTVEFGAGADVQLILSDHTPPPTSNTETDEDTDTTVPPFSDILKTIRSFLIAKPGVWRVLLFGSCLKDPTVARDIDIAIECRSAQDPSALVGWAESLSDQVGKPVEVIDLAGSFHDDMLAIRRNGRYIEPHGGLSDDPDFKNHQELMLRAARRMGELRDQLYSFVDGDSFRPTADSHGLAKRLEMFYQQFENYAERFLFKYKNLPRSNGGEPHNAIIVDAFRDGGVAHVNSGDVLSIPPMPNDTWTALDDLRRFRHFLRKQYVDYYYTPEQLFAKLPGLDRIVLWTKSAVLAVGHSF